MKITSVSAAKPSINIMDPATIAALGELFDKKIDKLETTIVEKVTLAVSENVSAIVTKNVEKKIESMIAPVSQRQKEYESRADRSEFQILESL